MGIEYKIKFNVPKNYDPTGLFRKLPSPINTSPRAEIYNYSIEEEGFYFIDHLVNDGVASVAFKRFVSEALSFGDSVEVVEL